MERIFGLGKLEALERAVATLGVFDGVHRGHQAILAATVDWARRIEGTCVVITFNRHPESVVAARPPEAITSLEHRLALIERCGVDFCVVLHFSKEMAETPAADFATDILVERLGVCGVALGFNARFGRAAEGDARLLEKIGTTAGFEVRTVPPLEIDGSPVSSTRVRTVITAGDIEAAERLLGRPVSLRGTVIHGDKRGRDLGFPTANLNLHHELTPPEGVYVGRAHLDGETHLALVNIGVRPTFCAGADVKKTIEVYIGDFDGQLYGETIEVDILKFLRRETRFETPEALKAQMERDRRILEKIRDVAGDAQTS